ncbi:MAG TPA: DivIVA domain-containing protein [Actinomycetota bacterium]|nr:DivIVA domain-containing protein [Actinomycetota bacterium]
MDRWGEQPAAEPIGEGEDTRTPGPWAMGSAEGADPALASPELAGPGMQARGPGDRIRAVTFQTTWRGYVPEQVQAYLGALADQVDAREARIRELEDELRELRQGRGTRDAARALREQPPADPYEGVAGRLAELMRSLEREAERLRSEAEAEAGRAVAEAHEEASRILAEARAEAERVRLDADAAAGEARAEASIVLRDARAQAERIVREAEAAAAAARERREEIRAELRSVREALDRVLGSAEPEASGEVVVLEDSSANGGARSDGTLS